MLSREGKTLNARTGMKEVGLGLGFSDLWFWRQERGAGIVPPERDREREDAREVVG